MICPYIVHRRLVVQLVRSFDDEIDTGHEYVENNLAVCMECQKENCAAWQDGKCNYKG